MTARHTKVHTGELAKYGEDILKMALALGSERLEELGVGVQIVAHRVVYCSDGELIDSFPWRRGITLGGTIGAGLALSCVESVTVEHTIDEEIAARGRARERPV